MAEWYLYLKSVKQKRSYDRDVLALDNVNKVFGDVRVNEIKLTDLENYQETRAERGRAPATIDLEISTVKTMVTKAFYDDKISNGSLYGLACK